MSKNASDSAAYIPPKVWQWDKSNGGMFAAINRPITRSVLHQPFVNSRLGVPFQHNGVILVGGIDVEVGKLVTVDLFNRFKNSASSQVITRPYHVGKTHAETAKPPIHT
ncbi:MAG TPA: hypothetical protein ENI05_14920 [Porticoccus sp.]|nr:hypothetical protein [Porticoccus sp.]